MLVGFTLNGNSSNEAEFFDGTEPESTLCRECGTCLNPEYVPQQLAIVKSQRYDISYTHDLRTIFSEKMMAFLRDELGCRDAFRQIKTSWDDHYYVFPSAIVPFDTVARKTRFISPCLTCGGYSEVIGARPAFIQVSKPLGIGLFRSDIQFASYKAKHPLLFVGREWMERIQEQKFRGVAFEEVHSHAPS